MRPLPDVESGRWQVSVNQGIFPRWSPDGAELFFATAPIGGPLMVARVDTEPTFRASAPEPLFDLGDLHTFGYDITPDGERFLVRRPVVAEGSDGNNQGLVFVSNWYQELLERVPTT